jgi:hypothetical protein
MKPATPFEWTLVHHSENRLPMSQMGLGRVKTRLRRMSIGILDPEAQATIAAINGLIPTMFMTRVRL